MKCSTVKPHGNVKPKLNSSKRWPKFQSSSNLTSLSLKIWKVSSSVASKSTRAAEWTFKNLRSGPSKTVILALSPLRKNTCLLWINATAPMKIFLKRNWHQKTRFLALWEKLQTESQWEFRRIGPTRTWWRWLKRTNLTILVQSTRKTSALARTPASNPSAKQSSTRTTP